MYDAQGRSGLLSLLEAKKTIAYVGGTLCEVNLGDIDLNELETIARHIDRVRELIHDLEPDCDCEGEQVCDECQGESDEDVVPEEDEEVLEEEVEREEVPVITPAAVENLAEDEGFTLPSYNEMKAELAAADKDPEFEFDLVAVTGGDNTKASIQKAYLYLQMLKKQDAAE